jgi:uncharacterized protein
MTLNRMATVAALTLAALTALPAQAQAPAPNNAKKELVARLVTLTQSGADNVARGIVEQQAAIVAQQLGPLVQRAPADKREQLGRDLQSDLRKFVDDTFPAMRERSQRLAPATLGAVLESQLSEEELRQAIVMLESPIYRKYQQVAIEMQRAVTQKLGEEARAIMQPRVSVLEQSIRKRFTDVGVNLPPSGQAPAGDTKR